MEHIRLLLYVIQEKTYRFTLHRLIAELFVENKDPENCVFVNHINENKNDFRAKNLEWVTPSENVLYSINTGTNKNCGETSKSSKITEEIANKICELIQEGYRTCEIVSILGVNRNTIRHIREGDTWKHVSKNYNLDFSNYKHFISEDEECNIINLKLSGKTHEEISKITGRSITAICKILRTAKIQVKPRKIVTNEIRSTVCFNVLNLYKYGLTIEEISLILGLKTDKVISVLISNRC